MYINILKALRSSAVKKPVEVSVTELLVDPENSLGNADVNHAPHLTNGVRDA